MKTPPASPQVVRDLLEKTRWGYQMNNGVVVSVFCPLCKAMVSFGNEDDPLNDDNKKHHIDFHVTDQKIYWSLYEQINELKKELRDVSSDSR